MPIQNLSEYTVLDGTGIDFDPLVPITFSITYTDGTRLFTENEKTVVQMQQVAAGVGAQALYLQCSAIITNHVTAGTVTADIVIDKIIKSSVDLSGAQSFAVSLSVPAQNATTYEFAINSEPAYSFLSVNAVEGDILIGLKAVVDADTANVPSKWTATIVGSELIIATADTNDIAISLLDELKVSLIPAFTTAEVDVRAVLGSRIMNRVLGDDGFWVIAPWGQSNTVPFGTGVYYPETAEHPLIWAQVPIHGAPAGTITDVSRDPLWTEPSVYGKQGPVGSYLAFNINNGVQYQRSSIKHYDGPRVVSAPFVNLQGTSGVVGGFARRLIEHLNDGRRILIVQGARSGTGFTDQNGAGMIWGEAETENISLFNMLKQDIDFALSDRSSELVTYLSIIGELDTQFQPSLFGAKLTEFYDGDGASLVGMRRSISSIGTKQSRAELDIVPVVHTTLAPDWVAFLSNKIIVNDALLDISNNIIYSHCANTENEPAISSNPTDLVHMDGNELETELNKRAFNSYLSARVNTLTNRTPSTMLIVKETIEAGNIVIEFTPSEGWPTPVQIRVEFALAGNITGGPYLIDELISAGSTQFTASALSEEAGTVIEYRFRGENSFANGPYSEVGSFEMPFAVANIWAQHKWPTAANTDGTNPVLTLSGTDVERWEDATVNNRDWAFFTNTQLNWTTLVADSSPVGAESSSLTPLLLGPAIMGSGSGVTFINRILVPDESGNATPRVIMGRQRSSAGAANGWLILIQNNNLLLWTEQNGFTALTFLLPADMLSTIGPTENWITVAFTYDVAADRVRLYAGSVTTAFAEVAEDIGSAFTIPTTLSVNFLLAANTVAPKWGGDFWYADDIISEGELSLPQIQNLIETNPASKFDTTVVPLPAFA